MIYFNKDLAYLNKKTTGNKKQETLTMSKKIARDYLRKEILRFTKGKDLKKPWKIEKLVRYNDKEHPNEQGHDTGERSGMWKMGTTIRPSENGYTLIHWTVVQGKVEWNAEIHFNKKMTPMCGHINTFMGSPLVYNGEKISKEYLCELIDEGTWIENYFSEENGFTFSGGVLEVEEVTEEEEEIQLTEENAIQYVYDNTSKYDDWVKGSDVYQELVEENKKLKKENENYEAMMIDAEAEDQGRDNTIAFLEEKNKQFQESDKHLNKCIDSIRDQYLELKEENKKLKQKATAWDIINGVDWEHLRDLCDKEMCKDLIACGECVEGDFEGYEPYEEEEE